ncbi:alpha-ketoglutarate-dependent dioxygenase AlkB [Luteimonas marina]|uniref:Alpha-ketoglutarate-dependent dioxygenase AlkB n=1 Tax=Luteimonas marina TaxID=488485 RepID=A0A5C5U5R0_9GAMM|nr:alpha-ketoglutarate-dependent dioxygenase AlkB [Luteimonas marina]TWT21208.1 alpha-ketoglutarate-dependent dioxygenase AlkB [Luteimonas marina]
MRMETVGEAPDAADLMLVRDWLDPGSASALVERLLHELPWQVHRVRLFGREVDSPRLSCWMGDPGAAYRYSGVRHEPHAWAEALLPIRDRLVRETGVAFNSALANLYRDGRDCMGWHSDDEPELGERPMIASLSLGAARRFVLKHRRDPGRKLAFELTNGSLLVMRGDTQEAYRHALPRTAKPVGPRINLTFRRILPDPRAITENAGSRTSKASP